MNSPNSNRIALFKSPLGDLGVIYFKQAIEMLKQNKFISMIAIAGTALAIMMIMVIIVTDAIKTVSIAPEINRDRTFYIKRYTKKYKDESKKGMWQSTPDYDLYKNYLSDFKTPQYATAVDFGWNGDQLMVKKMDVNERFLAKVRRTDAVYWKVMSFTFTAGKPFTEQDFASGIPNAVISESLAKKVFGKNEALGKTVEIGFHPYTVVGIVKDVSQTFLYGYGEAYIPYTSMTGYEKRGGYDILLVLKDKKDLAALTEEIKAAQRKFNSVDPEWNITFHGPYTQRQTQMNETQDMRPDEKTAYRKLIFIFAVLLLIPAVNLSGFSMSQIKRRTEEIGVRKAFGAKKYIILIQVLFENFITTLIGGCIGLILSYFVVAGLKEWLLDIDADSSIPVHALVSYPVLAGVFAACFLLNLLSAGIPAYRASKANIVDSINKKNN